MKNIMFVAIGGALGSLARYIVYNSSALIAALGITNIGNFPYATLTVNVIGSFLIAIIVGYTTYILVEKHYFLAMTTGFCGGFTTVSALASDLYFLNYQELYFQMLMYFLLTIIGGLISVVIGLSVGKGLAKR